MLEKINNVQRSKIMATGLATLALSGPGMYEFTESTNNKRVKDRVSANLCIKQLGKMVTVNERTAPESCRDYVTEIRANQTASDSDSTQVIPTREVREWAESTLDRSISDPAQAAQMGIGVGMGTWLMGVGIAIVSRGVRKGDNSDI